MSFPVDLRRTPIPEIPALNPAQELWVPIELVLAGYNGECMCGLWYNPMYGAYCMQSWKAQHMCFTVVMYIVCGIITFDTTLYSKSLKYFSPNIHTYSSTHRQADQGGHPQRQGRLRRPADRTGLRPLGAAVPAGEGWGRH